MTENTETKKEIKILAIESSCDETAAAVVVNGRDLRSNVISSLCVYPKTHPEMFSHIYFIVRCIDSAIMLSKGLSKPLVNV